jgi:hypothetical protein
MDEMDALGVSQATYGGGVDPGMAGDFTPSASDAAQQAAATGSMGQGTGTGGGFLGEGVPTGISGWDYQTTSGQTLSGLRDLQAQGLGSQMIPSGQTVNQAVASLNLARGLDFAAPYAVQAIPGVGSILTAARVAQGGFRELFNPFGNIDMIRDAVTRNQMERQTGQQAAFTARTNPEGGLTGGVGGVVGGAGSFSGDGGMSVTPAISSTLGNIPGGAAGLSTGLPGGRGYSGTAAGQVGAAGALGNLGEEEDDEERKRKQETGLFSKSKDIRGGWYGGTRRYAHVRRDAGSEPCNARSGPARAAHGRTGEPSDGRDASAAVRAAEPAAARRDPTGDHGGVAER